MSVVQHMILALAILARAALACESIAVLSGDGKYIVLHGATLQTTDVGNLRWKQVWEVDYVLGGSTSERVAFLPDGVPVDLDRPTLRSSESDLAVVTNLAERENMPMHFALSRRFEFAIRDAFWIEGTHELLVLDRHRSVFSVLDPALKTVDSWHAPGGISGNIKACRSDGGLVVRADRYHVVRGTDDHPSKVLVGDGDDLAGCRMEELSLGCLATMGCGSGREYEKVIVDLASNRLVSTLQFGNSADPNLSDHPDGARQTRMSSVALFDGGRRLLRQSKIWTPDPPQANSFRIRPGTLLRVLDTDGGAPVIENSDAPAGTVSRVFCQGSDERVVVSGEGRVHLMDLSSLKVIASVAIPFGRHFVF